MDEATAVREILNIICQLPPGPLLYGTIGALIESAEGNRAIRGELLNFLKRPNGGKVAAYIAMSLGEMYRESPDEVKEAILIALKHRSPEVKMWATDSLLDILDFAPDAMSDPETKQRIIDSWKESDVQVFWGAVLCRLGAHQEAERFLNRLIEIGDIERAMAFATGANMAQRVMELLPVALGHPSEDARLSALVAIGKLGIHESCVDEILSASTDPSRDVRKEACFLLAELSHNNDKAHQRLLKMVAEDDDSGAAYIAAESARLDSALMDALLLVAARWNNRDSEDIVEILSERAEIAQVIAKYQPQSPEVVKWYIKLFNRVAVRIAEKNLKSLEG